MRRVTKNVLMAVLGAIVGVVIGMIAGLAFIEFGRHACTGQECADEIVRRFIPLGAIAGGLWGILTAQAKRQDL